MHFAMIQPECRCCVLGIAAQYVFKLEHSSKILKV